MTDPFHEGQLRVQEQTGERDAAFRVGAIISDRIPPRAFDFLAKQTGCVLGWVSPDNTVWATFLVGHPGFASAEQDGAILRLGLTHADEAVAVAPLPDDGLRAGDALGTLFIELPTRRRLRINGTITVRSNNSLSLAVSQAFANCPKYIQRRETADAPACTPNQTERRHGEAFDDELAAWIREADTFFVASAHGSGRVDASHRGGNPGFVRLDGQRLSIPDYPGNSMYMTLGNFAANPRAGLVFVDFRRGMQLQLTGDVQLDLNRGEVAGETGGTGRWWVFYTRQWRVTPLNMPLSWRLIEPSPYNP